jgi:PadR family transcriptional regulator, regulatory protein PadR
MGYLGEFEQLILFSVLLLEGEAYGVAIREAIEERTGRVVSSGAIYTALGRMEERGLVTSRVAEAEGPGRPRKYYALEKAGAQALLKTYSTIRTMAGGLIPRLSRLVEE